MIYILANDIPRHKAIDELDQRKSRVELDREGMYQLLLDAYEDKQLADEQSAEYELRRLSSDGTDS